MNNRWLILAAGFLIQTVLGGIYAWSTFIPGLTEIQNLSKGQCGLIFGLSIGVFALTTIISGKLLILKGPRLTAGIGALLFTGGYLLASVSHGSFLVLLLGIGVIAGAGIGFGYVCPLSVGMKWFPNQKGLVTGVSVAGFGAGAIVLSSVAEFFFLRGMDPLEFFRWLALGSGSIMFSCALILADPPLLHRAQVTVSVNSAMLTPAFIIVTLGMFSGTFAGLLIIGNLTPLVMKAGLTESQAVIATSLFAVGNALGRIVWGHLFDSFGYRCIQLSLGGFALISAVLFISAYTTLLLVVVGLVGFFFGSNFVLYASAISRYFGTGAFAKLYPRCFLAYGMAGMIAPWMGGQMADSFGSYAPALVLGILVLSSSCFYIHRKINVFAQGAHVLKGRAVQISPV